MSRSRLRKLILGAAIAALSAWYELGQLLTGAGPSEAGAMTAGTIDADSVVGAMWFPTTPPFPQAELRERSRLTEAAWPADPFFRGGVGGREPSGESGVMVGETDFRPLLTAILQGDEPLAMINGAVLSVGDRLADGSTITAIDDYKVRLQGPQGPWILRLSE
jgi:hypothetical protein